MTGDKKTEEVRYPVDAATLDLLKRVARAHGFDSHAALAREWLLDRLRLEVHAAKVILGSVDVAGIDRNPSESVGAERRPAMSARSRV